MGADYITIRAMSYSRRSFMKWAATVSSLAASDGARRLCAEGATAVAFQASGSAFQPALLPRQHDVWEQQLWMAKLGPKYTGNKAHTTFVEFLATEFAKTGCDVAREHYTLPRWDARRWSITITPASGARFTAPVTSYFPYSGQTPAAGATGELVFAGSNPKFTLAGLQG